MVNKRTTDNPQNIRIIERVHQTLENFFSTFELVGINLYKYDPISGTLKAS